MDLICEWCEEVIDDGLMVCVSARKEGQANDDLFFCCVPHVVLALVQGMGDAAADGWKLLAARGHLN